MPAAGNSRSLTKTGWTKHGLGSPVKQSASAQENFFVVSLFSPNDFFFHPVSVSSLSSEN